MARRRRRPARRSPDGREWPARTPRSSSACQASSAARRGGPGGQAPGAVDDLVRPAHEAVERVDGRPHVARQAPRGARSTSGRGGAAGAGRPGRTPAAAGRRRCAPCEDTTLGRGSGMTPGGRMRLGRALRPGRLGACPIEIDRHTSPALFPPPGYSHAVVSRGGATVWSAGGVPLDGDGMLVGPGDLTAQGAGAGEPGRRAGGRGRAAGGRRAATVYVGRRRSGRTPASSGTRCRRRASRGPRDAPRRGAARRTRASWWRSRRTGGPRSADRRGARATRRRAAVLGRTGAWRAGASVRGSRPASCEGCGRAPARRSSRCRTSARAVSPAGEIAALARRLAAHLP